MGDTKITGDLASNLADLDPRNLNERKAYKKVAKAYERSVDLAHFYSDAPGEIELQRRIDFLGWSNAKRLKTRLSKAYGMDSLENKIVEFELNGTTYEADYLALKTQQHIVSRRWSAVEVSAKHAIGLYNTVTDGLPSYFKYVVPSYLAQAYEKQGNIVDAVLTYQDLIDKLDVEAGHKNRVSVSANAYAEWLRLRDEVIETHADDPRIDVIRNYTVAAGRSAELLPLVRFAPRMPVAFLRGSKSGWVQLEFDVTIEGYVANPIILNSTSRSIEKAALASIKE